MNKLIEYPTQQVKLNDISNITQQKSPSEDESFLQEFNFNRKQQSTYSFLSPAPRFDKVNDEAQNYEVSPMLQQSSVQRVQNSGVFSYAIDEMTPIKLEETLLVSQREQNSLQQLMRLTQLTKDGLNDFQQGCQLLIEKQIQITQIAEELVEKLIQNDEVGSMQMLQKVAETQHANDQFQGLYKSAQSKFEGVLQLASDCWNTFLLQITQTEQQQQLHAKVDQVTKSKVIPIYQEHQKENNKLKQQIYDLQAENNRFEELLKNRECHQLAFSQRRNFIEDSTDDERLNALEKDRLQKKVSRLQKRLEEEQDIMQQKRREWLMKEKELVAQRELMISQKDQQDGEILDLQGQQEQMSKQGQFKNEQIRQLERQLEDRRRNQNTDQGPINEMIRNLKQQIKTLQDESRNIHQVHVEQIGDRDREILDLEDKILNAQSELQDKEDQFVKVKKDRDRQSQDSIKHAQTCVDLKSELIDIQRNIRKFEREINDLKRQLDQSKKQVREVQMYSTSLETQIIKLQTQIENKDDQLVHLSQESHNSQTMIDSLHQQVKTCKDAMFKLQLLNKQLEQRLQEREMQLQLMKREGTDIDNKFVTMQLHFNEQLNQLNDRLQESQAIIYQFKEREEYQLLRLKDLEDSSNSSKSEISRLESQRRIFEVELQEKNNQLNLAQQNINQTEQAMQEQLQRLKEKYLDQVNDTQRLETELEDARIKSNNLKQEIQQTQELKDAEINSLRKAVNDQINEEKRQSKQIRIKFQEVQSELEDIRRHNLELKKSIQEKDLQLDQQISNINQVIEKPESESLIILNEYSKLKIDFKNKEKKCQQIEERLKVISKQKDDKQEEVQDLQQLLEVSKNSLNQSELIQSQKFKQLQQICDDQDDQIQRLQNDYNSIQIELTQKVEDQNKDLQKLSQVNGLLSSKDDRINQLTKCLEDAQKRPKFNDNLQDKLKQYTLQAVDARDKCVLAQSICKNLGTTSECGKTIDMIQQLSLILSNVLDRLEGLALFTSNQDYSFTEEKFENLTPEKYQYLLNQVNKTDSREIENELIILKEVQETMQQDQEKVSQIYEQQSQINEQNIILTETLKNQNLKNDKQIDLFINQIQVLKQNIEQSNDIEQELRNQNFKNIQQIENLEDQILNLDLKIKYFSDIETQQSNSKLENDQQLQIFQNQANTLKIQLEYFSDLESQQSDQVLKSSQLIQTLEDQIKVLNLKIDEFSDQEQNQIDLIQDMEAQIVKHLSHEVYVQNRFEDVSLQLATLRAQLESKRYLNTLWNQILDFERDTDLYQEQTQSQTQIQILDQNIEAKVNLLEEIISLLSRSGQITYNFQDNIITIRSQVIEIMKYFINSSQSLSFFTKDKLSFLFKLLDVDYDTLQDAFSQFIERLSLLKQTNDAHYNSIQSQNKQMKDLFLKLERLESRNDSENDIEENANWIQAEVDRQILLLESKYEQKQQFMQRQFRDYWKQMQGQENCNLKKENKDLKIQLQKRRSEPKSLFSEINLSQLQWTN